MTAWKLIVCAVDGSAGANAALGAATRVARGLGAELVLVHVEPKPQADASPGAAPAKENAALHAELARWAAAASDLRGERVGLKLVTGDPADRISSFAQHAGADLIVIGSRGARNGVPFTVGSTTARVLVLAKCPVMVVAPPAKEHAVARPGADRQLV